MNCDEAEELVGAYALDALPGNEAAAMRAHIEGCDDHAAKVAELRAVVLELPAIADQVAAPPALRGRVLDAVGREAAPSQQPRDIRTAMSSGRVLWSGMRLSPPAWGALAAALVISLGGLLAWNIVLQRRDNGGVDRLASRATSVATFQPSAGGAGGTVVYFAADKKALVVTDGLATLDAATKTYQMWAVHGGQMESIGLMQADAGGHAATVVPFDAARAGVIAVTVEPAGGSPQPTSAPILTSTCVDESPACAG